MGEYVTGRLLQAVITLFGLSIAVFLMIRLLPGDPARANLPPGASDAEVARERSRMKLDRPLYEQYGRWLSRAIQGDFGTSLQTRQPVSKILLERVPRTVQLAGVAMLVSSALGIALGIVSALRPGSILDYGVRMLALAGFAMPGFWFAIMLILLFAVVWNVLPTSGYGSPRFFVLPTITLAAQLVGVIASMVSATMIEVLREDHVRTARAKGLAERVVVLRHVLKNSFITLITLLGLQLGSLLGGAVIVETVFAWPGLGNLMTDSIGLRDYPVVQAAALLAGVIFLVINLSVDLLYGLADPRIRHR